MSAPKRAAGEAAWLEHGHKLARIVLGIQDFSIQRIPIARIHTDEKRFQNRNAAFSTRSRDSIVAAVQNGTFNPAIFDAILVWEDPEGKLFVLAGHSRLAAFRKLTEMGYEEFSSIPAKRFHGSEREAIEEALNSNIHASHETPWERAAYYRRLREVEGKSSKEVEGQAKRDHQANATTIIPLSYLHPNGPTLRTLELFAKTATEGDDMLRLINIAKWVGTILKDHPGLGRFQEENLLSYLHNGGHTGSLQDFRKKCRAAVKRWEALDDARAPLNITGAVPMEDAEKHLRNELRKLQQQEEEMRLAFFESFQRVLSSRIENQNLEEKTNAQLFQMVQADLPQMVQQIAREYIPALTRVRREIERAREALEQERARAAKAPKAASLLGGIEEHPILREAYALIRHGLRPLSLEGDRQLEAGEELLAHGYTAVYDTDPLIRKGIDRFVETLREMRNQQDVNDELAAALGL